MNINELKQVIGECDLCDNKICVNKDLKKVLEFIKNNYSFNMLKILDLCPILSMPISFCNISLLIGFLDIIWSKNNSTE